MLWKMFCRQGLAAAPQGRPASSPGHHRDKIELGWPEGAAGTGSNSTADSPSASPPPETAGGSLEKAPGRPRSRLPLPKEPVRQLDRDLLPRHVVTSRGGMALKLKEDRFNTDLGKKFFPVRR